MGEGEEGDGDRGTDWIGILIEKTGSERGRMRDEERRSILLAGQMGIGGGRLGR